MTNQELKRKMFQELAQNGITNKQVSISVKGSMYDDIVRVTIQDICLNIEKVESILKHHEEIRYDEHAQEILQGCNTFLEVKYNHDKIVQFRIDNQLAEKATKIYQDAQKDNNNGNAIYIIENDPRFLYFPKDESICILKSDGTQKHWSCWQYYEIMNVLTDYMLGHFEPLEEYNIKKAENDRLFKIQCEKREEERKLQEIEHQKYLTRHQKEMENINNSSVIIAVEPEKQEKFTFKWAHLNKNATLKEYINEVKAGEYYNRDGKITHIWTFTDFEALQSLKSNLLIDFSQLSGLGGSDTDDSRIKTIENFNSMSREQRDTVKWYNLVVAVVYNDKIQFVIDPQGFNYARYVGLIDSSGIIK
jgi:hypothetical protein